MTGLLPQLSAVQTGALRAIVIGAGFIFVLQRRRLPSHAREREEKRHQDHNKSRE
jgi:hypothetical protein